MRTDSMVDRGFVPSVAAHSPPATGIRWRSTGAHRRDRADHAKSREVTGDADQWPSDALRLRVKARTSVAVRTAVLFGGPPTIEWEAGKRVTRQRTKAETRAAEPGESEPGADEAEPSHEPHSGL